MRLLLVAPLVILAGCAVPPPPPPPVVVAAAPAPAPMVQRVRGPAAVCDVTRVGRFRSSNGDASGMTVSNDGGWCAKAYRQAGYPFTGGAIIDGPAHGEARVRHTARNSVLEYRANPGYVGSDRFTATLTPGSASYLVDVTVVSP